MLVHSIAGAAHEADNACCQQHGDNARQEYAVEYAAPPMERISGLVWLREVGERAGRTPGVITLSRSAPTSVPMVPLM